MARDFSENTADNSKFNLKHKLKIYQEEVKARHTTHWDLDYLKQDELEQLMRRPTVSRQPEKLSKRHKIQGRCSRWAAVFGMMLVVGTVAVAGVQFGGF